MSAIPALDILDICPDCRRPVIDNGNNGYEEQSDGYYHTACGDGAVGGD